MTPHQKQLLKTFFPDIPIQGDRGFNGVDGVSIKGDKGDRGEVGPKGDRGDVGPMGPAGRDGRDGQSIVGPRGPAGKDGIGIPGRDGRDGKDADVNNILETVEELTTGMKKVDGRIKLIDQRWGAHGGGLSKVTTDATLTGTGTPSNPLSVVHGGSGLTNPVDHLDYNTAYSPTGSEPIGSNYWDAANHTVSTVLENGVILQNGQEIHVYGKNTSGSIIYNGTPVAVTTANGQFTAFGHVDITSPASAYAFIGLATQDFAINAFGYVTKIGVVRDINTNSFTEGRAVYVSASGGLTNTYPTVPNYVVSVGVVEYKHAVHGRINVQSLIEPKLQDLSDVDGTPLTTDGQILVWNNTGKYFDANYNITSYGKFQTPTGTVNGTNRSFVWTTAPTVIVVNNGNSMQKVSSDGTVNWTGTTTTLLTVPPTRDIFSIA